MSTLKKIEEYIYVIECDYIIIVINPNSFKKRLYPCAIIVSCTHNPTSNHNKYKTLKTSHRVAQMHITQCK